jgi:hypothetical protein
MSTTTLTLQVNSVTNQVGNSVVSLVAPAGDENVAWRGAGTITLQGVSSEEAAKYVPGQSVTVAITFPA